MLVLSDGNWHSTEELVQEVGHRFSATIHVAKQKGDRIEKRRVSRNQFEYQLLFSGNDRLRAGKIVKGNEK